MSYSKFGERSYCDLKEESFMDSWNAEIKNAIGKSSAELGIYNNEEVEKKIRDLREEVLEMKEFSFVEGLKELKKDVGVFVVGGPVRDKVLGRKSKDIDLVVNRIDPVELIGYLKKYGKVMFDRNPNADLENMNEDDLKKLVLNSYGVIKFKPDGSTLGEMIDIAFPREDDHSNSNKDGIAGIKRDAEVAADPYLDISQDLARRDLTINAMAVDLVSGNIVDPFDGVEDLVKKEIRSVGDPRERILKEDLSRGFRAMRFCCVIDGKIEQNTLQALKEIFKPAEKSVAEIYAGNSNFNEILEYEKEAREEFGIVEGNMPRCLQVFYDKELQKPRLAVPREIISKEIIKAIESNPAKFLEVMDNAGAIDVIFPELKKLKGIAQPREHHMEGDVYTHTKMLVGNLPKNSSLRLKLAGLFHDLGKADSQVEKDGKIIFYGHDKEGGKHIENIFKRLKLPKELKDDLKWLVENHMFPLSDNAGKIKANKLEKMFLENEDLGRDLIALSQVDALSSIPEDGEPKLENINILIDRIKEIQKHAGNKKKAGMSQIVTGKDLIELGLKPGPQFKEILNEIRDAQLTGAIKSRGEGIEMVRGIVGV
ncbi:MAG: HD domain-containing protein [bacterium]